MVTLYMYVIYVPGGAATSSERFCKMFSDSSTDHRAVLQPQRCPSKEGELAENILQILSHDLMNNPVLNKTELWFRLIREKQTVY